MFKIIGSIDSSMLIGFIVLILILSNKKSRKHLWRILSSKAFLGLLISFAAVCLWMAFVVVINSTFDLSFLKTWIHVLIQLCIGICVYCFLRVKKQTSNIANYVIMAFIFQTAIEWLALISPAFKSIIYMTKSESTIRIANQYGGIRGLSLSGSSFFGLAISFGLVYIIYLSRYNTLFGKHKILKFIFFIFLVSGTFFAGRTGLVGLLLACVIPVARFILGKAKLNLNLAIVILVMILLGFAAFSFIAHELRHVNALFQKVGYLYDYVFEMFISLASGKGLSTTSTTELFGEMYFKVPFRTLLIGDGYYTDPVTGSYYMNTDSGYMRVILYLGLPGLILMFVFQHCIFSFGNMDKKVKYVCWIFLIILQTKGETIGFSMIFQSMLFLVVMQNSMAEKAPKRSTARTVNVNRLSCRRVNPA
ncbi:MAG: hypothetical protein NC184_07135 [Roseburia sp.]|nr:hypothetical protein [Roseburia sp.]